MPICYGRVRFRKRREEEPSKSAAVIASNDDLLTELLLRLPVKSLLKFKCVCKRWLSLISDPQFARRKHLMSNAISALIVDCCYWEDDNKEDYGIVGLDPSDTREALEHLNFAGYPERLIIQQLCNGLLLLREEEDRFGEGKYLVYNPTTKQSKRLPPIPVVPPFRTREEIYIWGATLAFDPSKSHLYKVVCFIYGDHGRDIMIYSSEIGRWRVYGAPFTPPFPFGVLTGVYCNGAIHWVSKKGDFLTYFDLNEELVQVMPMRPPLGNLERPRCYCGESRGCLYLVGKVRHLTAYLDVYQMETDRSGWFLKFRVDSDTLASEGIHISSILYVAGGEKEQDSFMVLSISNHKLSRYNFSSKTHQEICQLEFRTFVSGRAHAYIESLWPV